MKAQLWSMGSRWRSLRRADALALGIGTVFQHVMLVPTLTWRRISCSAIPGGGARTEGLELAPPLRQSPRISALQVNLDAKCPELSLGEQQQVEIIRASCATAGVLILDESTSMLDSRRD